MRSKKVLLQLTFTLLFSIGVYAQDKPSEVNGTPFPIEQEVRMPSEQTGENLGMKPSLRYGPGEGGNAQGEVPLGEADISILMLLSILSISYGIIRYYKTKLNVE